MSNLSTLKGIEQGRAEFAYNCVEQVITLRSFEGCTNNIIKKVYEQKFKKKLREQSNKKILDEFLNDPDLKIKEYEQEKNEDFKKEVYKFYEKCMKEYKSYLKKIPMFIKTNGLGATLAFMLSKGGTYEIIGGQILLWLKYEEKKVLNDVNKLNRFENLCKKVIQLNSPEYRALTAEILAFLNWMKRFADGLIEGENDE